MKVYEIVSMVTQEVFYVTAKDITDLYEKIEPYYNIYDGPFCCHGELEVSNRF